MSNNLWNRVANFFKEWDGEDMTKSMHLSVDELREVNSNRIELIRLEREHKEIRDKAIEEFCEKLKEKYGCLGYIDEISFKEVDEIAEKMKEVGE